MDFCTNCRKQTAYTVQKKIITKEIHGREYPFSITVAVCNECGENMGVPNIIDRNVQEIDEQYRAIEGIISKEDIEKLLKLYNIGKAPLSLALGFGEVTISRYLSGQIPSKEYSDIMKKALISPPYMRGLLENNRDKIADTAYNKAMAAAESLENLFTVSPQMLGTIAYIFEKLEEVTPLVLQKLLYFIQGISMALYDDEIFEENCEAWVHGPVYPEVYYLFKDFKYNPIDDVRFTMLDGAEEILTEQNRHIIDLVVNTFGIYGGKTLENITHNENPWKSARNGCGDDVPLRDQLSKETMKAYFKLKHEEFNFDSERGVKNYIQSMNK